MWIETSTLRTPCENRANSFASNGECGLKPVSGVLSVPHLGEFIRQQWRMWIETETSSSVNPASSNSFASNGECGLKQGSPGAEGWAVAKNSFASNGECGLKLRIPAGFTTASNNSFASNGECGLKLDLFFQVVARLPQFIRQQWRMWIETTIGPMVQTWKANSFASNGECELKQNRKQARGAFVA